MQQSPDLRAVLRRHAAAFAQVLSTSLTSRQVCRLDFTVANPLLQQVNLRNTEEFNEAVQQMLAQQQASVGIGGYLENRFIYSRSTHFTGASENRNLHLGIDVWVPAGTSVFSPLNAVVHSFQDNNNFGDYGPTIILQHELDGIPFFTLYGHLNRSSLPGLYVGKAFAKGEKIAEVGPYPENGDWPPHLHFQVISNMQGYSGDFPGVAALSENAKYSTLCPDPNLILQCPLLL
ncbi:peptidoglycan DD-metalloendopeptidase family protein [Pontibacter qinzhouensis]|uniref:Peptidoglycan DD-metalloendopeptidase family protein n=1 Tax=Pontibacter qinzhouensis TaxID=2603253 RepID=A0A5C8JID6_9BACT|nr:peptidoglycan DD-metalloendopeptidase family protein [Pontibacter qinzhouensis]TXK36756.1 peptidoglycan DD-metalloendopeptidase family protein [Pontibacter qinzhouensis]